MWPVNSAKRLRVAKWYVLGFLLLVTASFTMAHIPLWLHLFGPTKPHTQWVTLTTLTDSSEVPANRVVIPRLGIAAPLVLPSSSSDRDLQIALASGVAIDPLGETPNRAGTSILVGHSSDLLWHEGSYKTIFASLNHLQKGDAITVLYDSQTYNYVVRSESTVAADDFEALDAPADLILLTCWPPGTTLKRLLVYATLK